MGSCTKVLDYNTSMIMLNLSREMVTEMQKSLLYSSVDKLMIGRILPLVFAMGLAGNLSFLFTMLRVKWMRTVTNYYLANLAVADLLFLLVVVGEKIIAYSSSQLKGDILFGHVAGCILTNFLRRITFYASLSLVTLVSLERFYAICRPVQHRMLNGKKGTFQLVAICWVLSALFALILIPSGSNLCITEIIWLNVDGYQDLPNKLSACHAVNNNWTIASEGLLTVPFVIALVTNTFLYSSIIMNLHLRASSKSAKSTQSIEIRNQVARMLVINGTVFFLCLAPFQLASFTRMVRNALGLRSLLDSLSLTAIVWFFRVLVYLNSVINPIVYTATSPRYRHGFFIAFTCGDAEDRKKYSRGSQAATSATEKTCNTKI
ncbi:thyrotropin-releasing hormone receptor-like [Amphiura filiformis]|uniref:thyrotropin-releasing hormone receptor-like n=1 Tax=Amphiura filiformis TaxID=82378 RepID=UPI003B225D9B